MESNATNEMTERKAELNLSYLQKKIHAMERDNHKTKKMKSADMQDKIKKLIEEEVIKNGY